ncbi:MAG: CarD family transcriptional regulator [Clostridiales bacterium]|nr:CarD family transcriptional regulator [Clostridiales bacterium]
MYLVGDKIVHPMHGAGVVDEIVEQKVNGVSRQYYVLKMAVSNMLVMIPTMSCNEIGVRPVIKKAEADRVMSQLSSIEIDLTPNWNRRYRENMLRIKSGDLIEVAKVVKSLIMRERERGLSTGERKMLSSAKQIFISEMALAACCTYDEVENLINRSVC